MQEVRQAEPEQVYGAQLTLVPETQEPTPLHVLALVRVLAPLQTGAAQTVPAGE